MIKRLLNKIISLFQDHDKLMLLTLVDVFYNCTYADIEETLYGMSRKGMGHILDGGWRVTTDVISNPSLQKKLFELISIGYVSVGDRYLSMSEEGFEYKVKWICPIKYRQFINDALNRREVLKNGQTDSRQQ